MRYAVGQQRPLDVGDGLHLEVGRVERRFDGLREYERLRRPAEQVTHHDQVGNPVARECVRVFPGEDDGVDPDALVEVRDGEDRPLPGEVRRRRVVGREPQVGDEAGFVGVQQFGEDAAAVDREAVGLGPRVEWVFPQAKARDPEVGRAEPAAGEREAAGDRENFVHPPREDGVHFLRVGRPAEGAHQLDGRGEPAAPVPGLGVESVRRRGHAASAAVAPEGRRASRPH